MNKNDTPQLSNRELEVLTIVATGASNQQVADKLFLSIHTVKKHMTRIHNRLGVQSRTEATMLALKNGWITLPGHEKEAKDVTSSLTDTPDLNGTDTLDAAESRISEAVDEQTTEQPESEIELPPEPNMYLVAPSLHYMARWQQIYLFCAIFLTLGLMLFPLWPQSKTEAVYIPLHLKSESIPTVAPTVAPAVPQNWAYHTELRMPRAQLAVVALDDTLFAIGGSDNQNQATNQVDIYDPTTNQWHDGVPKNEATTYMNAQVISNTIYVPGGCNVDNEALDILEVYNPMSDTWRLGPTLPEPRCAYGSVAYEGELYLFGGWDGQDYTDTIFVFSPISDTWRLLDSHLPEAKGYLGAAVLNDDIYVVGGYDGQDEFDQTYTFSPQTDEWTEKATMQFPRGSLGLVATSNRLYAIGGGWEIPVLVSEEYDPATDSWSSFEIPFDTAWRDMGIAVIDPQIYALGGWNGEEIMTDVVSYRFVHKYFVPISIFTPN
ncbi:kelch repeat-containing protein [Anaerolineales bacterium HSG25]|nr:kelch repeat-containing protein [Anaerolineales bacterium HSG25]